MKPIRKAFTACVAAALTALVALVIVSPDNWHVSSVQAQQAPIGNVQVHRI